MELIRRFFQFLSITTTVLIFPQTIWCQIPDPTPPECYNFTVSEKDVTRFIFENYSTTIERPRLNAMHTVNLNLTLRISSINDVLEKERILRVTAFLALRWFDEFHRWNETFPLSCIPYLVMDSNQVWRPDIAQMNDRAGRYTLMEMPGEKIRLHSNGFTTFSPGGTFDAFCDFDFTLFPFDSQKCSIQLESWRYTSGFVSFTIHNPTRTYQWWENDQWTLTGTGEKLVAHTYTYAEMNFDRVEFYIYIKRKSKYYVLNTLVPSLIIALAQVSVFTLPLGEPSKLEVSFTCLLAYSVFQLTVSSDMPRSSDRVPLLSLYIGLEMFYVAFCMLGEGCVFILVNRAEENYGNVPKSLFQFALRLGKIVRLKPPAHTFDEDNRSFPGRENNLDAVEWIDGPEELQQDKKCLSVAEKSPISKSNNERMQFQALDHQSNNVKVRNNNEPSCNRERWIYLAALTDRLICTFYVVAIIVTPIIVFLVAVLFYSA